MSGRRTAKAGEAGVGSLYLMIWLIFVSAYVMIMAVRWANAPVVRMPDLLPLLGLTVSTLLFRLVFRPGVYQGDRIVPPMVLLLSGLGLLLQFRLGNIDLANLTLASTFAYPIGVMAYLASWMVFRRGRVAVLGRLALPALLLAVAVLGVILVMGQRYRGAVFMAGQINPAELVKLLLAVFMAGVLTDFRKPLQQTVSGIPAPPMRSVVTLGLLWAVPMGLLVLQRDLGMIILLNVTLLVLLFMATGRWGYLVLGTGFAAGASLLGFRFFSHAQVRFQAWLDPFADPTGKGWQILQSLSAMFSGGMMGSGLGSGAPTVVPIAASDFIYAAYAEELGFIGCILLVLVYLMLFYRGYRIADQLRAPFPQTLAAGLTTLLAMQTLMNMGGVTKAIPLTGITLPLLSHGGSSLITTLLMLGLLTALSEPGKKS